jgi:hypothetical protein
MSSRPSKRDQGSDDDEPRPSKEKGKKSSTKQSKEKGKSSTKKKDKSSTKKQGKSSTKKAASEEEPSASEEEQSASEEESAVEEAEPASASPAAAVSFPGVKNSVARSGMYEAEAASSIRNVTDELEKLEMSSSSTKSILRVKSATSKCITGLGGAERTISGVIQMLKSFMTDHKYEEGGRLSDSIAELNRVKREIRDNVNDLQESIREKTNKVETVTAEMKQVEAASLRKETALNVMKQAPCGKTAKVCTTSTNGCVRQGKPCTPSCVNAKNNLHILDCKNPNGCYDENFQLKTLVEVLTRQGAPKAAAAASM